MFYQKKPIVIEAFRYCFDEEPEWSLKNPSVNHCQTHNDMWLEIDTLEGIMKAMPGDYVIKGIKGEIYPCKNEIFKASYDLVASQMKEPEYNCMRGVSVPVELNPSRD